MKILKKLVWTIDIIVCLVVSLPIFIGWYLSPQDPIEKADVIVTVSGGDNHARIRKTVELYKEGWAPVILYSGAAAEGEVSNAEAMRNISVKMGVPKADILIEEASEDTGQNAEFSSAIIKEKDFRSMILVTSPYHQRRTMELFKKQLGEDFKIVNRSAVDEDWRKKGWWEDEQGRILTVGELGKIFINYIQTWRER